MATKKISQLEAITEAENSDVLVIVDVSEGTTNKITKNNLLKGTGHTIEMSLNENYQIVLKLKNAEGTELSTATIDLPNENAITNISYNNGVLTLTKQSGATSQVDISGLINGLATETALTNLANALKETIGIDTTTYNESQTYNTGDIVIQNEKIYKANQDNITGTFDSSKWDEISLYEYQKLQDEQTAENYKVITKLQEDVEDLTERVEDAENNEITNTPTPATSHYLQDSADSRFRKFIPIGRTTQESTTGKNKLPVEENLTFTQMKEINVSIPAGTYKLTYESEVHGGANSPRFRFSDNNVYITLNENEKNVILNSNETKAYIYSNNGYASSAGVSATIKKLMLSTNGGTYEPYTGGEPAPNPNYKMPIKNTGDNVNEFDKSTIDNGAIYKSNGNIDSDTLTTHQHSDYIKIEGSTQYYITIKTFPSSNYGYAFYDNNKTFISSIASTNLITTPANAKYLRICWAKTGTYASDINTIKLEQGSIATPYSPYGCGNVNEKVQNKNFAKLNEEIKSISGIDLKDRGVDYTVTDTIEFDGTVTGSAALTLLLSTINLLPDTYRLTVDVISGNINSAITISLRDENNEAIDNVSISNTGNSKTITTTKKIKYIGTYLGVGKVFDKYKIRIQLEKGSTSTEFQAHSEQNISFPLAEGQKFYEGSHPDDDEKVHHKWGEYVLDGTENFVLYNGCFQVSQLPQNIGSINEAKCNTYLFNPVHASITSVLNNYEFGWNNSKALTIRDDRFSSAEDYKAHLAEQYSNGTPVKVQYELAEEQTEDFTEEQKTAWEQIKKARTYKNVTHISSSDETPANVEMEYVQDTKTYIDNKVTELTNAITSLGGNV